ncbi:flagellar hook assembly protein FlgD [Undibacterium jejuense]|uniref:Basal-body rod modification protein FlgD n=1 Tax=Undibacterium jejuense TaxID=1344949 RepID=A0A923HBM4_9BURK|nr:flagellar hook assembly protein FlgD [Undibacterium jejuense]MBC3860679.1 flagellar hook assembly protein FlgD [Undibacterium jejuense]
MSTIQTNTVDPSLLATMNGAKAQANSIQTAQNQFMTLLTTQLKNQDPLNPMDNAQVTSQLAQLSTVTGINQVNASINAMNANFQAGQSLQAANMIGHGVLVPGNSIELTKTTNAAGASTTAGAYGLNLPQNISGGTVTITNAAGAVVKTINLGQMSQGVQTLSWDGSTDAGGVAPEGKYSYSVKASSGASAVTPTNLEFGMVSSVSAGAQGVSLNLANLGSVAMNSVVQIF